MHRLLETPGKVSGEKKDLKKVWTKGRKCDKMKVLQQSREKTYDKRTTPRTRSKV